MTPLAASGPLSVAVTVKVTVLPSLGVGLSTVLVTAMSAEGAAVTVELARRYMSVESLAASYTAINTEDFAAITETAA